MSALGWSIYTKQRIFSSVCSGNCRAGKWKQGLVKTGAGKRYPQKRFIAKALQF
jgi:hypothetical protein